MSVKIKEMSLFPSVLWSCMNASVPGRVPAMHLTCKGVDLPTFPQRLLRRRSGFYAWKGLFETKSKFQILSDSTGPPLFPLSPEWFVGTAWITFVPPFRKAIITPLPNTYPTHCVHLRTGSNEIVSKGPLVIRCYLWAVLMEKHPSVPQFYEIH